MALHWRAKTESKKMYIKSMNRMKESQRKMRKTYEEEDSPTFYANSTNLLSTVTA